MDENAKEFLAWELFYLAFDDLDPEQVLEVEKELKLRDSMGWRS